jgi:hypothetical protein
VFVALMAAKGGAPRAGSWIRPLNDVVGGGGSKDNAAKETGVTLLPHVRKYWNELNELCPKSCVFALLGMSRTGSVALTKEYAETVKGIFASKQRAIICIDPYPSHVRPVCVHPYSGRQVGLERQWSGLLCCVGPTFAQSRIPLATALEFTTCPPKYDPVSALKKAVQSLTLLSVEERDALLLVLQFCPTRLQSYYGKGERDLLRKKLDSQKFLDSFAIALERVTRSLPKWLPVASVRDTFDADVMQPMRELLSSKSAAAALRKAAKATDLSRKEKKKNMAVIRDAKKVVDAKLIGTK